MNKVTTIGPILLFDGDCSLCNSTVQFTVKRDKKGVFRFAPLQSETGQALLEKFNLPKNVFSTFVLTEGDRFYTKSSAALRLVRGLSGGWPLLYAFIIIPKPVRDFFYNIVSRNRYKWFGKQEACLLPSPEYKERFLV